MDAHLSECLPGYGGPGRHSLAQSSVRKRLSEAPGVHRLRPGAVGCSICCAIDDETGVARCRTAVTFALWQASQDVLEPDPFDDGGVLEQSDRGCQRRNEAAACLCFGQTAKAAPRRGYSASRAAFTRIEAGLSLQTPPAEGRRTSGSGHHRPGRYAAPVASTWLAGPRQPGRPRSPGRKHASSRR